MTILVTNDDGILAEGLWVLARELTNVSQVVVVAPDREQSAIGTAVTLHQPLRVHRVRPAVPEVNTYAVEGTPSDCVILALNMLFRNKVDMVISGINQGTNLGDDVLISGTVGAALQGYLRGLPALAVSIGSTGSHNLDTAARLASLVTKRIDTSVLSGNVFLNINLPNLPLTEIKGVQITRLASGFHTDTVKEGSDGKRKYYWLVRRQESKDADSDTDVGAIEQGNISITPLHTNLLNRPSPPISDSLCSVLLQELRELPSR